MISVSPRQRIVFVSLVALSAVGCSTLSSGKKSAEATPPNSAAPPVSVSEAAPPTAPAGTSLQAAPQTLAEENRNLKGQVNALVSRLEAMESRLNAMVEKVETAKSHAPAQPARIVPHSGSTGGVPVEAAETSADPAAGFVNDSAVQAYRKSMVLFRAGRHADAVLSFTAFLEKYPDHPLAGAAQYHVGESYLLQKEYKRAVQEFQRVLTSYDRSSHVAQTLREMAEAEDALKRTEDAARHRQLLMSLFPHSPFAISGADASAVSAASTSNSSSTAAPPAAAPAGSPAPTAAPPAKSGGTPSEPRQGTAAPAKPPRYDEPPMETIPPTAPAGESHSATEKE